MSYADNQLRVESNALQIENIRSLFLALELGSISAAAARLGVPPSTVSRRIRDLEDLVGAELAVRSGRGVSAPREAIGRLERLRGVLDAVEAALSPSGSESRALKTLRMTVPLEMSLALIPAAVGSLRERYPDLTFEVHGESRRAALIEEDFDFAVRVGDLEDSSFLSADLGPVPLALVAPSGRPLPDLSELQSLPCVEVMGASWPIAGRWRGALVSLAPPIAARVSSFTAAAALVARGVGLSVLPLYVAIGAIERGEVRSIDAFVMAASRAHGIYPRRHRNQPAISDLIASIRAALGRAPRVLST